MKNYLYRIAVAGPIERKKDEWVFGWDEPNIKIYDYVTAQIMAKKFNKWQFASFGELSCKYKAIKMK